MSKRQLGLYLAIGIIGGLLISACAGVASGKFEAPAMGEAPLGAGPMIDLQALPSLDLARPAQSATFMYEKASVTESLIEQSVTQGMSQTFHQGGLCARWDD